jgi:hypothetical protein
VLPACLPACSGGGENYRVLARFAVTVLLAAEGVAHEEFRGYGGHAQDR